MTSSYIKGVGLFTGGAVAGSLLTAPHLNLPPDASFEDRKLGPLVATGRPEQTRSIGERRRATIGIVKSTVNVRDPNTLKSMGTGYVVNINGNQYLVSARHLFNRTGLSTVRFVHNGQMYAFRTTRKNAIAKDNSDIVIFKPPKGLLPKTIGINKIMPSNEKIFPRDPVYVVGFPTGDLHVSEGIASTKALISPYGKKLDTYSADIDVSPGSSGSPVISSDTNELVGTVVAYHLTAEGLSYFQSTEPLIDILEKGFNEKIPSHGKKQDARRNADDRGFLASNFGEQLRLIRATKPPVAQRVKTDVIYKGSGLPTSKLLGE